MFVSLGSACRPGFQIKNYYKEKKLKYLAFPFDWTITPFFSLQNCFSEDFNLDYVLNPENLLINKVSSITDEYSGLIHHHDFHPSEVRRLCGDKFDTNIKAPYEISDSNLVDEARGRFIYSYNNISGINPKKKAAFFRWQRRGHPDREFPDLFLNETPEKLFSIVNGFVGHSNFVIIRIETWEVAGDLEGYEVIHRYEKKGKGIFSVIKERKGYDGDGSNDYRGDTRSWKMLFDRVCEEENIEI